MLPAQQQQREAAERAQILSLSEGQGNRALAKRALEGDLGMQRVTAEQSVADRALARRAGLTAPTEREQFAEGIRQTDLDRALQREEMLGEVGGRETLATRSLEQIGRQADDQRAIARESLEQQSQQFAGSLGLDYDRLSVQDQQFLDSLRQQDEQFASQTDIQRAELSGQVIDPVTGEPADTMQARQLAQEKDLSESALANELAQITGRTAAGDETLGGRALTEEARLAEAGLTGTLEDQQTLAAR